MSFPDDFTIHSSTSYVQVPFLASTILTNFVPLRSASMAIDEARRVCAASKRVQFLSEKDLCVGAPTEGRVEVLVLLAKPCFTI